jgi:MFS family permease
MIKRIRLFVGISLLWLPLSMLFDGLNILILPAYLVDRVPKTVPATLLGLTTFSGLVVGMMIQPIAGIYSDRVYSRWGRRGMFTLGVVLVFPLLLLLRIQSNFLVLLVMYCLI